MNSKKAKKQKIEQLEERINELNTYIKEIEDKLRARVSEDIDSYELSSDLGKQRGTRSRISDFLKMKRDYEKEKMRLEYLLRSIRGQNPKQMLIRF